MPLLRAHAAATLSLPALDPDPDPDLAPDLGPDPDP